MHDDFSGAHIAKTIDANRQRTLRKLECGAVCPGHKAKIGLVETHVRWASLEAGTHPVAHSHDIVVDFREGQITTQRDKVGHVGRQSLDPDGHRVGRNGLGENVVKSEHTHSGPCRHRCGGVGVLNDHFSGGHTRQAAELGTENTIGQLESKGTGLITKQTEVRVLEFDEHILSRSKARSHRLTHPDEPRLVALGLGAKAKAARQLHKTGDIDDKIAAQLLNRTAAAVHGQGKGFGGADHDLEFTATEVHHEVMLVN